MTNNPFNYSEPVREPELFFGRQIEVQNTLNFLTRSQAVSIIGPTDIGKTSLINYVMHPDTLQKQTIPEGTLAFVYIDCNEIAEVKQEICLRYIGRQITTQHKLPFTNITSFGELERLYHTHFEVTQKTLILAFDSFEKMISNDRLDVNFFITLRSFNTGFDIAYLTASESALDILESQHLTITDSSPFSNVFTSILLEPLEEEESNHLLHTYLNSVSDSLTNSQVSLGTVGFWQRLQARIGINKLQPKSQSGISKTIPLKRMIIEKANGHPHIMQRIGWEVVDLWYNYGKYGKWDQRCTDELLLILRQLGLDESQIEGRKPGG